MAAASSSGAASQKCASPLPTGVAGLPAPVILQTVCGAYAADEVGKVSVTSRRRAPWWSPSPFRLDIRRGRVVLLEHGRLRWRSHRIFGADPEHVSSVAVGAHDLAFRFADGKLWVARLNGREHPVAAREEALGWTNKGKLLTVQIGTGKTVLRVRREDGRRPRVITRGPQSFAWEDASRSLIYATGSRKLFRSDGRSKTLLADLAALGLGTPLNLGSLPRGLIAVRSSARIAILRHAGTFFASTAYESPIPLTYGYPAVAVGPDRVAFAVDVWAPDTSHSAEDVYLLEAGDTKAVKLESVESEFFGGCGWYARLEWHQNWLLYSDALTRVIALDTGRGGRVDLSAVAQHLPGVVPDPSGNGQTGFDFAVWG